MTKWVYAFGGGAAEGDTSMKNLLGGKGANLAEMASLGLPVPPGFTLTTEVCDRRFALDSYRRFITMYSDVVLGVHHHTYEDIIENHKDNQGYMLDTEMTADDWSIVIDQFKDATKRALGRDFPQDPQDQLQGAVDAVFGSWMNDRAVVYRRLNDIPAAWGTAVNVQAMVFGCKPGRVSGRRGPH